MKFKVEVDTQKGEELIKQNKYNDNFVVFDVRTKGEYRESHIENAINSDWYEKEEFAKYIKTLDKNKTYLIYCRTDNRSKQAAEFMQREGFDKVYIMLGGMTKWLEENRESEFASFPRELSVNLRSLEVDDSKNVKVEVKVVDPEGNPRVKSEVEIQILDGDEEVSKETLKMNNEKILVKEFTLGKDTENFKIKAIAKEQGWENGVAEIPVSSRNIDFNSFEEAKDKKFFIHLRENSREEGQIEKVYGIDFTNFKVKNASDKVEQLKDILDNKKKTMLLFGFPGCDGCNVMMKQMSTFIKDHPEFLKKYNFRVIVTSVDKNPQSTISFTEKKLDENDSSNLKELALYDSESKIWESKLGLQTTPNVVLLDEAGRLVNLSPGLVPSGVKDIFKRTFGEEININIDPNAKYDIYTENDAKTKPLRAKKGDKVSIEATGKGKFLRWESNRDIKFENETSKNTTFIMPDIEVIVKAIYAD